jgi:hypothetical protein
MQRWIYGLLIGLAAVAVVVLGLQWRSGSEEQRRLSSIGTEEAVAFTCGKLIHDSLPGDGEVLFLRRPSDKAGEQEAGRRLIKALATGLGSDSSRIVDVTPHRLTSEQQGGLLRTQTDGQWGEQFLQWVDGHPKPRAIVSFMGLPSDLPVETIRSLAPLLAFGSPGSLSVEEWLSQGNAFAWVVPRNDSTGMPPQRGSPQELFRAQFELRVANR